MVIEPLVWYCSPVANGLWSRSSENPFGVYTPCATQSLVVSVSNLVLMGLCLWRIWKTVKDCRVQRFSLRSKYYNLMLVLLAAYCTAEPLFRLVMGVSLFNVDRPAPLAPFEMVSLIIEASSWCSMVIMLGIERRVFIHDTYWYVKYGLLYASVADMVMLNLILSVKEFYSQSVLYQYFSGVLIRFSFGMLLLLYVPDLDPYSRHYHVCSESVADIEYEELSGEEKICPERNVNIFSEITYAWMNRLMHLAVKRPLMDKDVWKLDLSDQTETLISKFQLCWAKECHKCKPSLLRALNLSLGRRFWWGGFWKVIRPFNNLQGR